MILSRKVRKLERKNTEEKKSERKNSHDKKSERKESQDKKVEFRNLGEILFDKSNELKKFENQIVDKKPDKIPKPRNETFNEGDILPPNSVNTFELHSCSSDESDSQEI